MKVKIEDLIVGKYEYDSLIVTLDDVRTEICFTKEDMYKYRKYKNKTVDLEFNDGIYSINLNK